MRKKVEKAFDAEGGRVWEDVIVERIYRAVLEQRLPPGTKLVESALCEIFGVGRMHARRALLLLANRGIVRLHANRGAFIARPDAREAHEVFRARLAVEPSIVRNVVEVAGTADLDDLQRHIALEETARGARERRNIIRLSGEFHVKLAAASRNDLLRRFMLDLVTRTSLILGLYGTGGLASCSEHEHEDILSAVRDEDADRAAALMRSHLAHIEAGLDISADLGGAPDIVDVLGGVRADSMRIGSRSDRR